KVDRGFLVVGLRLGEEAERRQLEGGRLRLGLAERPLCGFRPRRRRRDAPGARRLGRRRLIDKRCRLVIDLGESIVIFTAIDMRLDAFAAMGEPWCRRVSMVVETARASWPLPGVARDQAPEPGGTAQCPVRENAEGEAEARRTFAIDIGLRRNVL